MNWRLLSSIMNAVGIITLAVIATFLLNACTGTKAALLREASFKYEAGALAATPGSTDFAPYRCRMGSRLAITVYPVGGLPPCGDVVNPTGCAYELPDGSLEIHVAGKMTEDGLVLWHGVLGHEIIHAMIYEAGPGLMVDPDEDRQKGY